METLQQLETKAILEMAEYIKQLELKLAAANEEIAHLNLLLQSK
jgi:hypothetical protein